MCPYRLIFLLCENVNEEKQEWRLTGVRPGLISCAARVPRLVHTQHASVHTAEGTDAPGQSLNSQSHSNSGGIQLKSFSLWIWRDIFVCVRECVRERKREFVFCLHIILFERVSAWVRLLKILLSMANMMRSWNLLFLTFCTWDLVQPFVFPGKQMVKNVLSALPEIARFSHVAVTPNSLWCVFK